MFLLWRSIDFFANMFVLWRFAHFFLKTWFYSDDSQSFLQTCFYPNDSQTFFFSKHVSTVTIHKKLLHYYVSTLTRHKKLFLSHKANIRRFVHSPWFHPIITDRGYWPDTWDKWSLARNSDRSWWHRHTSNIFIYLFIYYFHFYSLASAHDSMDKILKYTHNRN